MDAVVPPEITAELTQILSNLVLGDNEIRSNAEKAVNDRLAHSPELYILALTQFAIAADTDIMRSFSLVLLRRFLFRPPPATAQAPLAPAGPRLTLYDHLSSNTLTTLERLLLYSLSHEGSPSVRRKTVDTICDVAKQGMARGRPWHALQAQTFAMAREPGGAGGSGGAGLRESAYRVWAGCPNLVMDLQTDAVLQVFHKGLLDNDSIEVRYAALLASVAYLSAADSRQLAQALSLLYPILDTIHQLSQSLSSPPLGASVNPSLRLAALEFMVSLSEAKPSMVRKTEGWVDVIVRACLEGMGEFDEDEELSVWLQEDPSTSSDADSIPALYEQSLDRLACALGGKAVLPPAFKTIPSMLAAYDWRVRHAGLMAIAAISEGTGKVMQNELGKIVEMVVPMFRDSHPRVRYAACQCTGQLCTDLEEIIQEQYHPQLFPALIGALEDAEPRVHSHAAAALINFCEGVERDTLLPYMDPIVERLLKLLNPGQGGGGGGGGDGSGGMGRRYVQEQAITTLAMVADASEVTFAKHYPTIMPLLLSVLQNADGAEYKNLRIKAMECAGLIAIAVGKEVFRPDSNTLIELLIRIQKSPHDPNDTQLTHYLIATWAKICQAMGQEFEPYLPVVMPSLLTAASAKADISVYDEDVENMEEREGWEVIEMDGQTLGIRTSSIEDKCQAFETLVIYCSTLAEKYAPYLSQTLEITLPALKFYFHDGVREACAMLIPMLISCGKNSNTLTPQMVSASFHQIIHCISTEHDSSFLGSLYKCFHDSLLVLGGPTSLPADYQNALIEATKRQLQSMADRRKMRSNRLMSGGGGAGGGGAGALSLEPYEREDMAMMEEVEDYALEEVGRVLSMFDQNHPLLVAVGSVRDLGVSEWESDDGDVA